MTYELGKEAPRPEQLAFQAFREVRHTVIRVITAHLRTAAAVSWQGLHFDFTGVVFDGGDFARAQFSSGIANFARARFSGGIVRFYLAEFSGGTVFFRSAEFSHSSVDFGDAEFSGGEVDFIGAEFSGGKVYFDLARFPGGTVTFRGAEFSGSVATFTRAEFSGGTVDFSQVNDWSFPPKFPWSDTPPAGVQIPTKRATSDP